MEKVWVLFLQSRGFKSVEKIFSSKELGLEYINKKIAEENANFERINAKRLVDYPKCSKSRLAALWTPGSERGPNSWGWTRLLRNGQVPDWYRFTSYDVTSTPPTQKYRIPVEWKMTGFVTIEATSLDEAVRLVEDPNQDLPDGDYIDDSFEIVYNEIKDWN